MPKAKYGDSTRGKKKYMQNTSTCRQEAQRGAPVNTVYEHYDPDNEVEDHTESDSDTTDNENEYLFSTRTAQNNCKLPHAKISVDGFPLDMIIDTGASINVMDEQTFSKLKPKPALRHDETKIITYGSTARIPCVGKFQATFSSASKTKQKCTVHVVKGDYGSLISYDTAHSLGLIQLVNQVNSENAQSLYQQYPSLFSDTVGTLKDFTVKLHIDPDIQPIAQSHRRILFHLRKKVEKKIEELEKEDIIEKV